MRVLPTTGERCRGAGPVATDADAQRGCEMSGEDLQRPGMVHRARDAGDLEVAQVDDEPGLRVRHPVEPDHGAVNLVQGVGTESVAQPLAQDGLDRFEQDLEVASLGAVEGNRRYQLSGHRQSLVLAAGRAGFWG